MQVRTPRHLVRGRSERMHPTASIRHMHAAETSQTSRTLVVVPTFDEANNLPTLLRRIRESVPDADVLVVDDNSPDGTADIADALGSELGRVTTLRRPAKLGLGSAYRAGFAHAIDKGYDVLVQMDADLSHDPAALPALLDGLGRGADLVIGSRYVPGGKIPHWPMHRRMLSRWGNRYAGAMLRTRIRDATSGYRAVRTDLLVHIDYASTKANGYGFLIEQTHRVARAGARIDEVPITFVDRARGTSKMSPFIVIEAMALVTRWGIRDRIRSS